MSSSPRFSFKYAGDGQYRITVDGVESGKVLTKALADDILEWLRSIEVCECGEDHSDDEADFV